VLYVFLTLRPPQPRAPHSFPTRRSSDLARSHQVLRERSAGAPVDDASALERREHGLVVALRAERPELHRHEVRHGLVPVQDPDRSEEHTSELQSRENLVCRLLLEKKKLK